MLKSISIAAVAFAATILSMELRGQRDLKAGFGAQLQVVDLLKATGGGHSIGVQHLDGEIFVTGRGNTGAGGKHFVTVFDGSGSGASVRSWTQPGFAQASEWGFHDGATDGNNLLFGFDFGIEIVGVDGVLQTGMLAPNIETANGPRTVFGGLISGNVLDADKAGMVRALAYDRNGDGGDGSFWTGNVTTSIFEIDIAGDVITSYPRDSNEWSWGFALDPLSPGGNTRMWINAAPGFRGPIAEYDLTTGTLTGRSMDVGEKLSWYGGLDVVPGSLARGPDASGFDILYLRQDGLSKPHDEYRIQRLHLDQAGVGVPPSPFDRNGALEPDLLGAIDGVQSSDRSDSAIQYYTNDSSELDMFFDISRNPGNGMGAGGGNGTIGAIWVNIGADAILGLDATSNFLGIRELTHLQPLLTMPSAIRAPISRGVVASNDPMNPGPSEWRVALTPGMPFAAIGECIRAQAVYIDQTVNFLPIAMTNQLRFCRGEDPFPLAGTFAECIGGNNFNSDTASGFWSLTNDESDPNLSIVAATWSINFGGTGKSANTQNLINNLFRWDTDQGGMADIFAGGGSQLTDCLGTYRNGSEVISGLIFAGTVQQNLQFCDSGAMQGWVGSVDGPTAYGSSNGDWLQLDFTFSPDTFMNGAKFEWDADTDGGVGADANAMAGVIVTVEFRNGTISSGEIVPHPDIITRAFAQL